MPIKKDYSVSIKVKYHNPTVQKIEKIEEGDWIDLRAARGYHIKAGDFRLIDLGVSIKLPEGYEAHLAPRSSTFKNWGLLQTNSVGVIDSSYCGESDVWMMPVYATRDVDIYAGDKICQFRIMRNQPPVKIIEVEHMEDEDRGGFGSTGRK